MPQESLLNASSTARLVTHDTEFARDVYVGLTAHQKIIPARYLYDQVGSALFEAITLLPEYGLTRAEQRLLESCAVEIARRLAPVSVIVELGSGSGQKTQQILEAFTRYQPEVTYFAIDVSRRSLEDCSRNLSGIRGVRARTMQASYLDGLASVSQQRRGDGSLLALFLGSSIGNFADEELRPFLTGLRRNLREGDALLLGTDLVKSEDRLVRAYDDPAGVTAAFNLNLLARINRELKGDFRIREFRHEARWRADKNRIEMHLVARKPQFVTVARAQCRASFEAGESIWTEASQKFTLEILQQVAEDCRFAQTAQWIDQDWPFAENLWVAE